MKSQSSKRARKDKKQGKEASNNPTLVKWNEMDRKQRREMMRKVQSEDLSLQVVHPHAAGIDIGNPIMWRYRQAATLNQSAALAAPLPS
jgi:hypothetical protein